MNIVSPIAFLKVKRRFKVLIFSVFFLLNKNLIAQQVVVLPGNGSFSQAASPQGNFRYQRGFYLITPAEMKASGFENGKPVTSIGFTLGAAQHDTTKGAFTLYLENTRDTVSRVDTGWKYVTVNDDSLAILSGLFSGAYEWQVRAVCSDNSPFSEVTTFSNDQLSSCMNATNLYTSNVTDSSAKFNWNSSSSSATKYYVQYRTSDSTVWIEDSTTNNFFEASGLQAEKNYIWRVRTRCSSFNSDYTSSSFIAGSQVSCNAPSALTIGTVADSTAQISWTGADGASYYGIRYRRVGTSTWVTGVSFITSYLIQSNLAPGTTYEWQVRTVCSSGTGAYATGNDFTTSGTAVCYAPGNLTTNSVTDSSVLFKWALVYGAGSYEVRYRLKETISWDHAIAPMTLVDDDSLKIPNTTGSFMIPFHNGSGFTYTGQGVYVAWQYSNDTGSISSANTTVGTTANTSVKDRNGVDSIKYLLSFTTRTDSLAKDVQSTLVSTSLRPETIFGSSYLQDSVAVSEVYALGNEAPAYTSSPVRALLTNNMSTAQTIPVTLTVKEANSNLQRYSEVKNIKLPANSDTLVSFDEWQPSVFERDSIIVSMPSQTGENVLNNNRNYYVQTVGSSIVSYDDGSKLMTQTGLDSSQGLLLTRYHLEGCGKINSVQVYLSASALGHSVYGIAEDSSGNIIATSAPYVPDSSHVNGYHSFYFSNSPSLKDEDYYVGVAQTEYASGYLPVGVQWEGKSVRKNAYYVAKLNGDSLTDYSKTGRLMIRAELIPGVAAAAITGNLNLCSGTKDTLTVSAKTERFADSVIAFSSQASNNVYSADKVLGIPDVYPAYGSNPKAWSGNSQDSRGEYLTLKFPDPAPVNMVEIFETFNPGAVDSVFVKNPGTGNFEMVYSAKAKSLPKASRINRITFPTTSYDVSEIKITMASDSVQGYNSIDAVAIGKLTTPATFSSIVWSPDSETSFQTIVSSPGTYHLTVTNANGCSTTDSAKVVAPNTVAPVITARGTTTFCQGDSVRLISDKVGGNIWSTGATTDSIFVKAGGQYTVSYDDGTGCGLITSSPVTVTVNPLPAVTITGKTTICPGGSTNIDAGSFSSYRWNTGETSRNIDVTTPGTYTVTVTNATGCSESGSIVMTRASLPSPSISGKLSFCPGDSTTLDAGSGYSSYLWSTNDTSQTITRFKDSTYTVTVTNADGCAASASVTTSAYPSPVPKISGDSGYCINGSVTLTASSSYQNYLWSDNDVTNETTINSPGDYTVTVTDNNGCTGTSAPKSIRQFASPSPVISGTLSFCGGSSVTLDAGTGYASYLWSTGETNHSISASSIQTYSVKVTDLHGCTGSASVTTNSDNAIPETPGAVTGNASGICNSTQVYSVAPVGNTTNYEWEVPNGITILEGQGTPQITVQVKSGFTSGDLTVAASNSCGESPALHPRTLALEAAPAIPEQIFGPTKVCGGVQENYFVPGVSSASSYTWTVPAGAIILSGQGTSQVSVAFDASYITGDICVRSNSVSCGSSAQKCLTVAGIPPQPQPITGPMVVCPRQASVEYSIPVVSGATSYVWTVPQQASISSGQGSTSIMVAFGNKGGLVTVAAVDGCSTGVLQTQNIVVNCNNAAIRSGILQGDIEISGISKITAYPNPSKGQFVLEIPTEAQVQKYLVKVTDPQGRNVYEKTFDSPGNIIPLNLSNLPKGLYFVNVLRAGETDVLKIIVN